MTLEGHALAIGYRDRLVGEGLDLALAEGEVLALLGPNGGGKTTLLENIARAAAAARRRGAVWRAVARRDLDPRTRAALGLCAAVACGDLRVSGRNRGADGANRPRQSVQPADRQDRDVAVAALERFGIGNLAARPYTMISGGERQLVLLARALAQEPRFIVLDEPTASLDFGNQGKVMREIRALAASGHGVLFTTHDPEPGPAAC